MFVRVPLILFAFFLSCPSVHSEDAPAAKHAWVFNNDYDGQYRVDYERMKNQIPVLMRQMLINIAVRLGLDFQEGWQYPLTVQCVDTVPPGAENALAFVQMASDGKGFFQFLNINMTAYASEKFDFQRVLSHELVHAMLNDALGGPAAMKIPVWLHEGLAVYGADQGEKMLKTYVYSTTGFSESQLLNGLDGDHGALDYAEDYLAIKYIVVKKGQNSLHNFVRDTVRKGGDYKAALAYTCFENWDQFQNNVTEFSKDQIRMIGPAEVGFDRKPY